MAYYCDKNWFFSITFENYPCMLVPCAFLLVARHLIYNRRHLFKTYKRIVFRISSEYNFSRSHKNVDAMKNYLLQSLGMIVILIFNPSIL